jgi:hypothetical protein
MSAHCDGSGAGGKLRSLASSPDSLAELPVALLPLAPASPFGESGGDGGEVAHPNPITESAIHAPFLRWNEMLPGGRSPDECASMARKHNTSRSFHGIDAQDLAREPAPGRQGRCDQTS